MLRNAMMLLITKLNSKLWFNYYLKLLSEYNSYLDGLGFPNIYLPQLRVDCKYTFQKNPTG